MKKVVRIAILVASAGAFALACGKRPLSADRDAGGGGLGGTVSVGRGGAGAGGGGGAGGTTVVDDCKNHDVDIPSALLTGAVTINGVAAEPDPKARFLMRSGPNDLVEIPFTGASYAVRVAPGTYDLFFAATGPTLAAPANQLALLYAGVTVAPTGTTTLDIDVRSTPVAGTITVNGAPLAEGDAVSLSLRNAAGDIVPIATASNGAYSARVMPGTFDLFFSSNAAVAGSATPKNQLAKLAAGVIVAGTGEATMQLDVDVPSAAVSGAITFNGVPASGATGGHLALRNAAGDVVPITAASDASYEARVVPGTYDLFFTGTDAVFTVGNQNARLRTGVVVAPGRTTPLDVDVPWASVEGTIRFNGATPTEDDTAHLTLRNAAGDGVAIVWDADGTYRVRMLPGKYDLFYSQGLRTPEFAPANQLARLRADIAVATAGVTRLDVDVPSTIITGTLNINGEPGGSETGNSGIVSLRAGEIDRATIANTARPTFSTRVVPGTYDVYYTRTATPSNTMTPAPANHAARLHAGIVVAPGAMTMFDINIPSTTVSGRITVNGLPVGAGDHGTLMLRSEDGDYASFGPTNADSYTARLVPGTYDLYFSHAETAGDATPMNTLVRLRCFTVP